MLEKLIMLADTYIQVISQQFQLFKEECKLALFSFKWLIVITFFAILIAASTWLTLIVYTTMGLYYLFHSLSLAIFLICIFQLIALIVLGYTMRYLLRLMSFQKSRKHIGQLTTVKKSSNEVVP